MPIAINEFKVALLSFDELRAKEVISEAIESHGLNYTLGSVIGDTLTEIGEDWAKGDLALSQLYMASRISERVCKELFDFSGTPAEGQGPLAICTLGDYHVLGKRIIMSILSASGYRIIDLGEGLSVEELVKKVLWHQTKFLMVSTLMLPSALMVKDLRKELDALNYPITIMV